MDGRKGGREMKENNNTSPWQIVSSVVELTAVLSERHNGRCG